MDESLRARGAGLVIRCGDVVAEVAALVRRGRIAVPDGLAHGRIPSARGICAGPVSPQLPRGGERAGRARLNAWLRSDARDCDAAHDDLAADGASRLSPYLHFGCLSPIELLGRDGITEGSRGGLAGATSTPRSSPPDPRPCGATCGHGVTGGGTRPPSSPA